MQPESEPMLITRRTALALGALTTGVIALRAAHADAAGADADGSEISYTAAVIHQEPEFAAAPARVYAALLDPRQFDRIVEFSGVIQAMHLKSAGSRINPHAGGAFALFGGFITGRQLDLLPNQRIVQAWRPAAWEPGLYSIVRFELKPHNSDTTIVLDHTGFPEGDFTHLEWGWNAHYWEPLRKSFS